MGDNDRRGRPGKGSQCPEGDPFSALDRAALLGVHLLHRLPGQQRRIQGDGAGPLWRAALQGADSRQDRRSEGRRLVPPEHGVFQLHHRPDDDQRPLRRAVRRARPQAGHRAADPVPHGYCRLGSGGDRGDHPAPDAVGGGGIRDPEPVPGRRRGAELRRQRQDSPRRRVREHLDPARRRRCRRRGRRGACRLACRAGPGAAGPAAGRDEGGLSGSELQPGGDRPGPCRRRRGLRDRAGGRDDRPHRRSTGRGKGGGLVPGADGIRAPRAGGALDHRRPTLRDNAEDAQSQGQVPRELSPLRPVGPARGRGDLLRARPGQAPTCCLSPASNPGCASK